MFNTNNFLKIRLKYLAFLAVQKYIELNQRLDLNEKYKSRLTMIMKRKLTLLSDEY